MKKFLFVVAILGAVYWWHSHRGGGCGTPGAVACPDAELEEGIGVTLNAADVCPTAGYLCYQRPSFQVMRWPLDKGKLRIRVTVPGFLKGEQAQSVRDAVIDGLKEWDGRPFPLIIDASTASPTPDLSVSWVSTKSEAGQAGHAFQRGMPDGKRLRYSAGDLTIVVPQSETGPIPLERIRATAAHELGHALGLGHSDAANDLMYYQYRRDGGRVIPTARDFQTVDALYALPNGAMVR